MKRHRNGKVTDCGSEPERWVTKYRESGLGLRQFAQRHGLKPGQLHYWVYASPKPQRSPTVGPTFQEVRWPVAAATAGSWTAEVGLPNGTTVRLAQQTDVAWAIVLIDSLRRPCSLL